MGRDIERTSFEPEQFIRFRGRLERNLHQLESLLQQPGFGTGPQTLGAELELYIVDQAGCPLGINQQLREDIDDPQLTSELNRYNLEYNLSAQRLQGRPFAALEAEMLSKLAGLRKVAAARGARIVPTGILPTLRETDFGPQCMTDLKRYHALVNQLIGRRGDDFKIDIDGIDPLQLAMKGITLEGANTSFQIHYRVPPDRYAATFNAVQLITPLAVAIAANSPTLFGHRLWHETRVPLFKQSIDIRKRDRSSWNEPSRVNFGNGWVRRDALELFAETVRLYPPLLPLCSKETTTPSAMAPSLAELRLHQSTVWLWNRPVYDPVDGGHLRIEMRALPAGPTPIDMVANAAFLIGLAEGIRPNLESLLPGLPFHLADYNFHRAAEQGLEARLVWPYPNQSGYREDSVANIIGNLLPVARDGLAGLGIDRSEANHYLGIIERRLSNGQNGAVWQLAQLQKRSEDLPLEKAMHQLLERYIEHSVSNIPVSEWPI